MELEKVLRGSWQLFKENAGKLITLFLVYFIISIGTSFILGFIPILGWILSSIVSTMFLAGIYYAYLKVYRGEPAIVDDIFYPLKEVLNKLVVMSIIKIVFITLGLLFFILPGLYLSVSYLFAELLIVDKKMDSWKALEESRKRITKNWFAYFALLVVLIIINLIGAIPFGLGLIVTVPISIMAIVSAYASEFQESRNIR